jgi:hypothetical protein
VGESAVSGNISEGIAVARAKYTSIGIVLFVGAMGLANSAVAQQVPPVQVGIARCTAQGDPWDDALDIRTLGEWSAGNTGIGFATTPENRRFFIQFLYYVPVGTNVQSAIANTKSIEVCWLDSSGVEHCPGGAWTIFPSTLTGTVQDVTTDPRTGTLSDALVKPCATTMTTIPGQTLTSPLMQCGADWPTNQFIVLPVKSDSGAFFDWGDAAFSDRSLTIRVTTNDGTQVLISNRPIFVVQQL